MKRWTSLIMLLVLAGLAFWLWKEKGGDTSLDRSLTEFSIADTARVDRVFIADQNGKTIDLKRTASGWTLNGLYAAKQHSVDLLLKTFKRIEVRAPVPKAAEETVLRVMSSTAKKVEIYMGTAKPIKTWYVGHGTQDHFGTYMLLEMAAERSNVPFEMGMSGFSGILSTRFHTTVDDWRDTKLISYPALTKIASYSVDRPRSPSDGFNIDVSNNGSFTVNDAAGQAVDQPDSMAVANTLIPLRGLNFEFFERSMSKARRDSVLQSTPLHVVKIGTRDRSVQEVRFWERRPATYSVEDDRDILPVDPDRMFSCVNDTELVVVQRHLFDRILPLPEQLK